MAPSFKHFPFLLLLILFSNSLQIHARDSQFFSKVTNPNNNAKETELPNYTTNSNVKEESQLPNKEELQSKQLKEQEQQPAFIPDTQEGYGLYGHGSGQLPPSTTGNNIPYTEYSKNNYYYNKNSYNANQQGMKDAMLYDKGYTTMSNKNNYYNGDSMYNSYNNNGYNTKKQGMSDTRFLENGRYYYDLNSENNYPNEYENSRREYSRNEYNNRGYYGNNNNNNNNENSYEFDNSMEGYQNQEEYQESQDEFVP